VEDDLKKILDEQGKLLREIRGHTKALHRAMIWGRVWSLVSLFAFFILPLVLVYYYVYPAFQNYLASFKAVTSGQMRPDQFMSNIPPMFQSMMKLQGIDLEALQKQARQNSGAQNLGGQAQQRMNAGSKSRQ